MHETKPCVSLGKNGQGQKETTHQSRTKAALAADEACPALKMAKPGFIYLVRLKRLIKIGRTTTPKSRLLDMLTILPEARLLHLMHVPDAGIERELHVKYRAQRVHGEWFRLGYRDVKAIKKIAPCVSMDHMPLRTPHQKRMDVFRATMRSREKAAPKDFVTISVRHRGHRPETIRIIRYDSKRFFALGKIQAASTIGKRIALVLEALL